MVHKKVSQARAYAYGDTCVACLLCCKTQAKLVKHLQGKTLMTKCLAILQEKFLPMQQSEVDELDRKDREEARKLSKMGKCFTSPSSIQDFYEDIASALYRSSMYRMGDSIYD